MLITGNFEAHALKLVSPDITLQQRQTLVTEMRDSIEIVHTSEYGNFLKHLFPAFYKLLSEGKPQFTEVRARAALLQAGASIRVHVGIVGTSDTQIWQSLRPWINPYEVQNENSKQPNADR